MLNLRASLFCAVVRMMGLLTTYPQMLAAFAFCPYAFGIGVIWLLWPKKMQEYALKHCTKFYSWQNPFLGWMKTRSYLVYLRVMGLVLLAAGLFALLFALTSYATVRQRDCEKHMKDEIHPGTSLDIAVAALKKCGFKTTLDPVKKSLYGDKLIDIEGSLVWERYHIWERTQVLVNLDSKNRVTTVIVTTGLIGP
jgi:hypothetical protein